jgi:hypothetical protein
VPESSRETSVTEDDALPLARAIHAAFLAQSRHAVSDPALLPFDQLREDLKLSNLGQARYAVAVLARAGYGVRRPEGPPAPVVIEETGVEIMAEMEHGRWVVERLCRGWMRGALRDPARRVSPYLIAWRDLPDAIRQQDRDAVQAWPALFAEAGLEVFRMSEG